MASVSKAEKLSLCSGCREDFYNGKNTIGVQECWSLKTAKIVKRWRLGWWTTPDTPEAFREVRTLNCHSAPGQYAHYEQLPNWAVSPRRLKP